MYCRNSASRARNGKLRKIRGILRFDEETAGPECAKCATMAQLERAGQTFMAQVAHWEGGVGSGSRFSDFGGRSAAFGDNTTLSWKPHSWRSAQLRRSAIIVEKRHQSHKLRRSGTCSGIIPNLGNYRWNGLLPGRARHSVRAVVCQRAFTDSPGRRARSDAPCHPRFTVCHREML